MCGITQYDRQTSFEHLFRQQCFPETSIKVTIAYTRAKRHISPECTKQLWLHPDHASDLQNPNVCKYIIYCSVNVKSKYTFISAVAQD